MVCSTKWARPFSWASSSRVPVSTIKTRCAISPGRSLCISLMPFGSTVSVKFMGLSIDLFSNIVQKSGCKDTTFPKHSYICNFKIKLIPI